MASNNPQALKVSGKGFLSFNHNYYSRTNTNTDTAVFLFLCVVRKLVCSTSACQDRNKKEV